MYVEVVKISVHVFFKQKLEMLSQSKDAPADQLQHAEEAIREHKEKVKKYETEVNEHEAKLNQGLFLIYNVCNYGCAMNPG